MQFFFQEWYSHIDKNSGKKFEDMFLVKIASQGTSLRHILQVKPVRYILSCCHGNKITKGTSQNLAPKKSEKSAIFKDIELKFGIETKFGPLSSKTNKCLQFDVIMTFLAFRPFC